MNDSKGFWSSVPGVVTGVASVVTAAVGLIGAGVTLGWFGNKDNDKGTSVSAAATTTITTSPLATTTTLFGRTGGTTATTATPSSLTPLQASPATLTFDALGARDQKVTVRNTTASSISLSAPSVAGVDASEFTAKDLTCGARLDANRTCEVQVTYRATTAGTANAKLVLQPVGQPALEVPLKGNRII